jgi:hypothetical protein
MCNTFIKSTYIVFITIAIRFLSKTGNPYSPASPSPPESFLIKVKNKICPSYRVHPEATTGITIFIRAIALKLA